MRHSIVATAIAILVPSTAAAATVPAAGYLYQREVLPELTEACITQGPGGVYVAVGPPLAFPTPSGGTRSIVFVSDGGAVRTVATGLNSVGDCVYDAGADVLYVTDGGQEFMGAVTGDTVFAIPGGATNLPVAGLEVLPAGSIPYAYSVDILGDGLLVSDAAGSGLGSVFEIDLSGMVPSASTFADGFDYTGGLVVDGDRVIVAEAVQPTFESRFNEYTPAGVFVSTISGPTYGHGSNDLDIAPDGGVLVSGAPTLASVDDMGTVTPLVAGLDGGTGFDAFGGGISVQDFTGRIDFLASSFSGADDDKSVHRLVPVDRLVPGGGSATTDCTVEFYGLELVPPSPSRPARSAICVDGAACDADGTADGTCTFPLGLCLNVDDARLADCTPSAVGTLELRRARPESAELTALVAEAASLLPTADSTCVFGEGVRIPVRVLSSGGTRPGKGIVKLVAATDEERPRKDGDVAKLVCVPAP